MNHIKKILIASVIIGSYLEATAESSQVYYWKSEKGTPVFSEKKPRHTTNFKTINVGKPTVVDTKAPKPEDKNVKIDQSDIEKLDNSKLAEENKQALEKNQSEGQVLEVTITSPKESENKFSKEQEIPIITSPKLDAKDKPIFMVNGSSVPGKFENGKWLIPRPNPGQNKITITGNTADGKEIKSTNAATLRIFNGTIKQMKNTGNYRQAVTN